MLIQNHDVYGIVKRLDRFTEEMHKSQSSPVSELNDFDKARLLTYLDAVDSYHKWVNDQPALDLPESHPRDYNVVDSVSYADVENESVNDVIRLLALARAELLNSQSSRLGAKLIKFDSSRFSSLVDKARRLIKDYVEVSTPLDLPESSPQSPSSGPGRTGV